MKKFLLLTLIFSAVISTASYAQPAPPATQGQAPDPAVMLQQMKEKIVPQMVAKTGLTEALANKVIEINFEMRMAAAGLRDLNEADRSAKIAELKATKQKKISELLTPEQIKSVNDFYESLGKNKP
jgi:Spy/CpxP family protein refolding chaperone